MIDEISERIRFIFLGVKTNLHIVLIMDFTRPTFTVACQSNPGFFKECAVQWIEGWSERSMLKVLKSFLFNIHHRFCIYLDSIDVILQRSFRRKRFY
jgi:hypothetical protein